MHHIIGAASPVLITFGYYHNEKTRRFFLMQRALQHLQWKSLDWLEMETPSLERGHGYYAPYACAPTILNRECAPILSKMRAPRRNPTRSHEAKKRAKIWWAKTVRMPPHCSCKVTSNPLKSWEPCWACRWPIRSAKLPQLSEPSGNQRTCC